jgi:L-lactate dehydrogenase complex protein LldG
LVSARDLIFGSIRRSLGVSGHEAPRRKAVDDRLAQHPQGLVPARGQLPPKERLALFRAIPDAAAVPTAIAAFLRGHNLPMAVKHGSDPRLAALPWERERNLTVSVGPSDGKDLAAVSHAFGAVAESGTLMLVSGADNPTTLNFLPDTHLVVVDAKDVVGDYETLWRRLREKFGGGTMPRTVNLITGPSRSADIEQTLILGAHGPRRLHVLMVGEVVNH